MNYQMRRENYTHSINTYNTYTQSQHLHFTPSQIHQSRLQPPSDPTRNIPEQTSNRHTLDISYQRAPNFTNLRQQITTLRSEVTKLVNRDQNRIENKHILYNSHFLFKEKCASPLIGKVETEFSPIKRSEVDTKHGFNDLGEESQKRTLVTRLRKGSHIEPKDVRPLFQRNGEISKKEFVQIPSNMNNPKCQRPPSEKKNNQQSRQRIEYLQAQLKSMEENKKKIEQQNCGLLKKQGVQQSLFKQQLQLVRGELQKQRKANDHMKFSLSLKNCLTQKLQIEVQQLKKNLKASEDKNGLFLANYEQKSKKMQEEHSNILAKLTQELKECDEKNRIYLWQLQQTQNTLEQQSQESKIHQLKDGKKGKDLRQIEEENIDLKKRVESYRKSLQQFNKSSNANRDKQAALKQNLKTTQQELKVKESLIGSLYGNIRHLDEEVSHLKEVIAQFAKNNEELNQTIVRMEIQRLNSKYAYI